MNYTHIHSQVAPSSIKPFYFNNTICTYRKYILPQTFLVICTGFVNNSFTYYTDSHFCIQIKKNQCWQGCKHLCFRHRSLTGFVTMPTMVCGQTSAIACVRSRTMPALVLNRSSRVIPVKAQKWQNNEATNKLNLLYMPNLESTVVCSKFC